MPSCDSENGFVSMDASLDVFRYNTTDGSYAALSSPAAALPNIRTTGSSCAKIDYFHNHSS